MKTRCTHGRAKWERSENVVEWKYGPFPFIFLRVRFEYILLILDALLPVCVGHDFWVFGLEADGRIARFAGGQEYSFSGEAELSSETNRKAWSRPPIGMEFSIVMFTSSGLLVRYLKVIEKSGYRYPPDNPPTLTLPSNAPTTATPPPRQG